VEVARSETGHNTERPWSGDRRNGVAVCQRPTPSRVPLIFSGVPLNITRTPLITTRGRLISVGSPLIFSGVPLNLVGAPLIFTRGPLPAAVDG